MEPLVQIPETGIDHLGIGLAVAAVLLVGGAIAARWHKDQLRFALMKAALEKGVTQFPGTPPYWLVSLRQGVMLLATGVALTGVGLGAWFLGRGVEMPATAQVQPSATEPDHTPDRPHHDDGPPPPRPEDFGPGPDRGGPDGPHPGGPPPPRHEHGSHDVGGHSDHDRPRPRNDHPHPPSFSPAMERWHHAQIQQTTGLASAAIGIVLAFLGLVRIAFAKVEQRCMANSDETGLY